MSPFRFCLILIIGVLAGSFGTKYHLTKQIPGVQNSLEALIALKAQEQLVGSCLKNGVYFARNVREKKGVIISCEFMQVQSIGPDKYDLIMAELEALYRASEEIK